MDTKVALSPQDALSSGYIDRENFGTTGIAIEFLDEKSSTTWPEESVRRVAVAGARAAWRRFVQLMAESAAARAPN